MYHFAIFYRQTTMCSFGWLVKTGSLEAITLCNICSIDIDTFLIILKGIKIWLFFSRRNGVTHTREMLSPAFRLKTGVQADQEGMIRGLFKYVLFCLDPINVLEEEHTEIHRKVHQRSFCHCTLELISWISTVLDWPSSTDEARLCARWAAAGEKGWASRSRSWSLSTAGG